MGQNTAILDIGSSKIICLLCCPDGREGFLVRGAGIREYDGYRDGRFLDVQQFSGALVEALTMAEEEAKIRVRNLNIGVPAPFLKLIVHDGRVELGGRGKKVTMDTVDQLIDASLEFAQPEGYALMHSTPIEFDTGAGPRPEVSVGQAAPYLSGPVSHVYVQEELKSLISAALDKVGLDADMYIGAPLSSGLFVIPPAERADCAVLIDVGARHTDLSVLRGNALNLSRWAAAILPGIWPMPSAFPGRQRKASSAGMCFLWIIRIPSTRCGSLPAARCGWNTRPSNTFWKPGPRNWWS